MGRAGEGEAQRGGASDQVAQTNCKGSYYSGAQARLTVWKESNCGETCRRYSS